MYFHFANVLVFTAFAILFVGGMMLLGSLLRPHNPEPSKLTTYECGEPPTGTAWINFNIRFYLIALIFVIFDVEVAFVYPVAAVFREWVAEGRGLFALVEVALFLGILFIGLVYAWRKGDLAWLKKTSLFLAEEPRAAVREAA
ncbi:MAG: NADH-quinone oxidoreductase subunit A [Candidatus Binatia bacterium]|nr:MAG: NADH-quinone oxidoreductase subunit A [Candidatus Binatia bacterium]